MDQAEHRAHIDERRDDADQQRTDFHRVHERIDALVTEMGKLTTAVEVSVALCKECRPKVTGNGGRGLPERVADLEAVTRMSGWFITKILAAVSIAAAVFGSAATVATHLWTNGKTP